MTLFHWNVLAGMWFFLATRGGTVTLVGNTIANINFYLFSALALVAFARTAGLLP